MSSPPLTLDISSKTVFAVRSYHNFAVIINLNEVQHSVPRSQIGGQACPRFVSVMSVSAIFCRKYLLSLLCRTFGSLGSIFIAILRYRSVSLGSNLVSDLSKNDSHSMTSVVKSSWI